MSIVVVADVNIVNCTFIVQKRTRIEQNKKKKPSCSNGLQKYRNVNRYCLNCFLIQINLCLKMEYVTFSCQLVIMDPCCNGIIPIEYIIR